MLSIIPQEDIRVRAGFFYQAFSWVTPPKEGFRETVGAYPKQWIFLLMITQSIGICRTVDVTGRWQFRNTTHQREKREIVWRMSSIALTETCIAK